MLDLLVPWYLTCLNKVMRFCQIKVIGSVRLLWLVLNDFSCLPGILGYDPPTSECKAQLLIFSLYMMCLKCVVDMCKAQLLYFALYNWLDKRFMLRTQLCVSCLVFGL